MYLKPTIVLLSLSVSAIAHANLPLKIEDLTADKNKFKLETSVSYANQSKSSFANDGFDFVDLGSGRGIYVPSVVSETETNTDRLVGSLGLAYGIDDRWEVGIRTNGIWAKSRYQTNDILREESKVNFQGIDLTTQFRLTKNHASLPDSLLFAEISAFDQTKGLKPQAFSSVLLGGSIYHVNDPMVFSITGGYLWQRPRTLESDKTIYLGNALNLSATAGFSVNPDVTLSAGIHWQRKQGSRILGQTADRLHTQTNLNLGLAYAVNARHTLSANLRTDISGGSGSVFTLGITSKLGELPPPLSQRYRQK